MTSTQASKTDPINQALQAQDWRRAVKLAAKLDANEVARAMRAFALLKLSKRQEALELVESVVANMPKWAATPDGPRIRFFAKKVLTLAHRPERLVEAFRATDAPIEHVDSLARVGDLAEMQSACMKLARASKDPVEAQVMWLWACVCSCARVKHNAPADDAQLVMSEALAAKATHTGFKHAQLKNWIAQRRALPPSCAFPDTQDGLWAGAQFHLAQDRPDDAFAACDALLRRFDPDHWSALELMARLARRGEGKPGALSVLLAELDAAQPARRGPLLAQSALALLGLPEADGPKLVDGVRAYVLRFGARPCCVEDLRNVCLALSPYPSGSAKPAPPTAPPASLREELARAAQERRWPPEQVAFRVPCPSELRAGLVQFLLGQAASADHRRSVGAYQLLRMIGVPAADIDGEQGLVAALVARARVAATQHPVDRAACDDFVLLASHVLIDIGTTESLLDAAGLLEQARAESPSCYQLTLLLQEVYGERLGAGRAAVDMCDALLLKHIQMDSLGYLKLCDAGNCGLFELGAAQAAAVGDAVVKMTVESLDMYSEAVRSGNGDGAMDVWRLVTRLRESMQLAMARTHRFALSLAGKEEAVAARVKVELGDPGKAGFDVVPPEQRVAKVVKQDVRALVDNGDFVVQASWDVPLGPGHEDAMARLSRAGPMSRVARQSSSSCAYLHTRREREEAWVRVRIGAGMCLNALFSGSAGSGGAVSRWEELGAELQRLGMYELDEVGLLWRLGFAALGTMRCAGQQDALAVLGPLLGELKELLVQANGQPGMFGFSPRASRTYAEWQSLVSVAVSHALVWTCLVCGTWNRRMSKNPDVAAVAEASAKLCKALATEVARTDVGEAEQMLGKGCKFARPECIKAAADKAAASRKESIAQLAEALTRYAGICKAKLEL